MPIAAQDAGDEPVSAAKMRAGAKVGDDEPARNAVEPAVERLVQVARRRGDDAIARAHQDEHRDRQQRETVQAGVEGLGDEVERTQALGTDQEGDRDAAEREGDGGAGEQGRERHQHDQEALRNSLTGAPPLDQRWPPAAQQRQDLGQALQRQQPHAEGQRAIGNS